MKLTVQFGRETCFDPPIRLTSQIPWTVVAWDPVFAAPGGRRRTAEANQARIDLWVFLGGF